MSVRNGVYSKSIIIKKKHIISKQKYTAIRSSTDHTVNQIFGHSQNPLRSRSSLVDLHCVCTQVIVHALEFGKCFIHTSHTKLEASFLLNHSKNNGICSKRIVNKNECHILFSVKYVIFKCRCITVFFFKSLERFPCRKMQLKYEVIQILCNESPSATPGRE